jgi:CRISPR type I-E-associated protein CasB/Cse2
MMASEKTSAFVTWILSKTGTNADKGFLAKLKKAESEATEYQAWEILARWIDLEKPWERRAYGIIGASLARLKTGTDGSLGIGEALKALFIKRGGSGEIDSSAEAVRLRRLLSCKDQEEAVEVIRPLLRYLVGQEIHVSHTKLLDELLWFDVDASREKTRLRWAKDFYSKKESGEASS